MAPVGEPSSRTTVSHGAGVLVGTPGQRGGEWSPALNKKIYILRINFVCFQFSWAKCLFKVRFEVFREFSDQMIAAASRDQTHFPCNNVTKLVLFVNYYSIRLSVILIRTLPAITFSTSTDLTSNDLMTEDMAVLLLNLSNIVIKMRFFAESGLCREDLW